MLLLAPKEMDGRRLDRCLMAYLNGAPPSFVQKILRKKRVRLNGRRASGGERVAGGDEIALHLSEATVGAFRDCGPAAEAGPMPEIVYEDDRMLVANKPAGMGSHSGEGHLLGRLLFYLQSKGEYPPGAAFAPGLANRLDTNTSGLVICGKTPQGLQKCAAWFRDGKIAKEYLAVAEGHAETATLRGYHKKDAARRMALVSPKPRPGGPESEIVTACTVLARRGGRSLLLVSPREGRFHQIRAHLASAGHPLTGDRKYAAPGTSHPKGVKFQLLHCRRLSVPEEGAQWDAAPPGPFADAVAEMFGGRALDF